MISAVLSVAVALSAGATPADKKLIRIATDNTDLVLEVGPNNRLYQTYRGANTQGQTDRYLLADGRYIPLPVMRISSSPLSVSLMQTEI